MLSELRAGVSIMELMIVIVIIALLSVSTLYGVDIVTKFKVMNTMVHIQDLEKSYQMFDMQYGKRPGDMNTAYQHFTIDAFNDQCRYHDGDNFISFTLGVSGNGDDIIDETDISHKNGVTDAHLESSAALCHLKLAGLLPSDYRDKPIVYKNKAALLKVKHVDGVKLFNNDKIFFNSFSNQNYIFVGNQVLQDPLSGRLMYSANMPDDMFEALESKFKADKVRVLFAGLATSIKDANSIKDPKNSFSLKSQEHLITDDMEQKYCDTATLNKLIGSRNALQICMHNPDYYTANCYIWSNQPSASQFHAVTLHTLPDTFWYAADYTKMTACVLNQNHVCMCESHLKNGSNPDWLFVDPDKPAIRKLLGIDAPSMLTPFAYILHN